jgi:Uma2 family endonuclease
MPRRSLDPKDYPPAGGVWTYEEYMKLPVEATRYEVIAGELYITPPPPVRHQVALLKLMMPMFRAEEDLGLGILFMGPLDVIFGEGDFIEPDIIFVRRERAEIIKDHGIEGVPDLIVECIAPETAERDRGLKRERYALLGVPEYWVFDAEARTLEIYRNHGSAADQPDVVRDHWTWQPDPGGPVLELSLIEILERYEESKQFFEPFMLQWRAAMERLSTSPTSTKDIDCG